MNAMTWYDHETSSIWSQPWGRAIVGSLKGVQLNLLPSQLTTWGSWKQQYPDTKVMVTDVDRLGGRQQGFHPDFIVGLALAGHARAYYYRDIQVAGVINDKLGEIPVALWATGDTVYAYVRMVNREALTFHTEGEKLVDDETGSEWDGARGLAKTGPLSGESLQPVPSLTSYDWAWRDFYPDSEFYTP